MPGVAVVGWVCEQIFTGSGGLENIKGIGQQNHNSHFSQKWNSKSPPSRKQRGKDGAPEFRSE